LQPLWITLPIAADCCQYCIVHAKLIAKLDFVSVFGLNYIAICAGLETTVNPFWRPLIVTVTIAVTVFEPGLRVTGQWVGLGHGSG